MMTLMTTWTSNLSLNIKVTIIKKALTFDHLAAFNADETLRFFKLAAQESTDLWDEAKILELIINQR